MFATLFAYLLFLAIGIALLGMFALMVMNFVLAWRAIRGKGNIYISGGSSADMSGVRRDLDEIRREIKLQRNDDWLRDHNKQN